jgi:ribosomal protein S18 acetylase RimI-like enzyme
MIEIKKIDVVKIEEVEQLYRDAGWWHDDYVAEKFIQKMASGSCCFAGAFDNGKMIGMGRAVSDGASDAFIQDVTVLGEYRGQGIGKQIVNFVISDLKQKGIDWIGLIACPRTETFYAELGFKPMERHIPMLLEITKSTQS